MKQIDNRGGIALFKIPGPLVKDVKKGTVTQSATYCTFPSDQIGDDKMRKNFKMLAEARATMPAIPDTSRKTMSKADHATKAATSYGKKR